MIYLDSNATTRPNRNMLGAVSEEVYNTFGNPSSLHFAGQNAEDLLREHREAVASAINARPSEVIFTSGGTESNNIVLNNDENRLKFVSSVEHSSVANCDARYRIPVTSQCLLDLEALEDKLKRTNKKVLISVMVANNETGTFLDPENKLYELKDKYGFVLHMDAVQAFGKMNLDMEESNIDLLSISGHKCHALKGVGALYVNRKLDSKITPLFVGGSHERGMRPGTENQIGIASLGYMAKKISEDVFYKSRISSIEFLRDLLEEEISDISKVNGSVKHRTSNTLNVCFPELGYTHEDQLDLFLETLSDKGVYISGKSACASGMPAPSRVLRAMFGKEAEEVYNSVRISLSVDTTKAEVDMAAVLIRESYDLCKKGMESKDG